jgi:hypothetical protein
MTLTSSLSALCDLLGSQTGTQVIIGFPDDSKPGIYVWPWRLLEQDPARNVASRPHPRPDVVPGTSIDLLILAMPGFAPDGLSKLEAAHQAIHAHPLLDFAGGRAEIIWKALSVEELAAIFTSSSLPVTICLSFTLRLME